MAETKTPAMSVADLKRMEAQLAAGREAAKTTIVAEITDRIAQLGEIGYTFLLTEGSGTVPKKRTGRPLKVPVQA